MTRRKADDDVKTKTTPPTPGRRRGRLLQLYAPKLPVVSSAFVFGLFALLAPLLERQYHRLATDGRLVSDVPTVSHELGRFTVKWDKSDLQLKVRWKKEERGGGEKGCGGTPPDFRSFVRAFGKRSTHVKSHTRASFFSLSLSLCLSLSPSPLVSG